jgi:hypothetical protein
MLVDTLPESRSYTIEITYADHQLSLSGTGKTLSTYTTNSAVSGGMFSYQASLLADYDDTLTILAHTWTDSGTQMFVVDDYTIDTGSSYITKSLSSLIDPLLAHPLPLRQTLSSLVHMDQIKLSCKPFLKGKHLVKRCSFGTQALFAPKYYDPLPIDIQ